MGKVHDQQEVSSPSWTTIVVPECTLACTSAIGFQNGPGLQYIINETAGLAKVSLIIILRQQTVLNTDWERLDVVVTRSAHAGKPQVAGHPI